MTIEETALYELYEVYQRHGQYACCERFDEKYASLGKYMLCSPCASPTPHIKGECVVCGNIKEK